MPPKKKEEKVELKYPVSSILLWGNLGCGKTLAALSTPVKPCILIDTERSSQIYFEQTEQLKAIGIDISDIERIECLDKTSFFETNRKLKEKYLGKEKMGTLVIDTYNLAEDWFNDYFWNLPEIQQQSMKKGQTALIWGKFKSMMKDVLLDWLAMSKLLILTTHARGEFVGGAPTGEKQPKCGEVPLETMEMVVMLHREPNQVIPSGFTTPPKGKSRIIGLPPCIPDFELKKLESFIRDPQEWGKHLAPEERIIDKVTKTLEGNGRSASFA